MLQKREWELDEIARSIQEAAHTSDARLVADEGNVERYLSPPTTTVYPLEYVSSLLGDVRGQTVLDFGCGAGENCMPLVRRGAHVIGVDISEALIRLAMRRLELNEPVRDSRLLRAVRRLIPYRTPDVSAYERPLTTPELHHFASPFRGFAMRAFSLPFVNLTNALPALRKYVHSAYCLDGAIIERFLPGESDLDARRLGVEVYSANIQAGIKDFRWYDLRHTFTDERGRSPYVAELLRDSSQAMVMRYAHLAFDYRLAAVERVHTAFAIGATATKTATGGLNTSTGAVNVVQ